MLALPPALAPLGTYRQFVTWYAAPIPDKPGKFNKFPCHYATGMVVGATARDAWTDFATASLWAPVYDRGHGAGVGFCFAPEDPFWFWDVDGCLTPEGWSPLAHEICARLAGAAIEISHSGRGLHLIGSGQAPPHGCVNRRLNMEFYTEGRFVALTGNGAQGSVLADCTAALPQLVADYFTPGAAATDGADWTTEPVAEWSGPDDDDELMRRALASAARSAQAAFGNGLTLAQLWAGDMEAIRAVWASGQSEADQALANHLAFWTGKNCERIERLMRKSGLARDKWDTRRPGGTYLTQTIEQACSFVQQVYSQPATAEPAPVAPVQPIPEGIKAAELRRGQGVEYLAGHDQPGYFDGCVYVQSHKAIWSLKHGELFDKAVFDVVYGGFLFVVDPQGRKTTDSAFEAFTKSRINDPVQAADVCFRPELPSGAMVTEAGANRALVNTYTPPVVQAVEGDVSRFTQWFAKILPDAEDRTKLLSYMASMVQNPGHKFQWWPVIQGVQGNGKSMLIEIMSYCVGEQYSHLPNVQAMAREGMKFNGWIYRKLFIGLEEVALSHKRDFLEDLKMVVTGRKLGVERKGAEQFMGDNRVNGMAVTNHRDGMPIDDKERRWGMFFTAQQSEADIIRDGMGGDYFPDLYDWLRGEGAYAGRTAGLSHLAHHLRTVAIEAQYDPARLAHRAPQTSSTREAIGWSMGRAEQEVREAIEEGRPGFAGGWVSSKYLDQLLEAVRAPVPRNKRRDMMRSLGYDWHPHLPDGRVNDVVNPDMGKPKLYVRGGHEACNLTEPAEIARTYSKAQEPGAQSAVILAFARK